MCGGDDGQEWRQYMRFEGESGVKGNAKELNRGRDDMAVLNIKVKVWNNYTK